MTTERKREASRRNGRGSRGPVSENGKARAAQNARTHGLCSRATLVLANEDADAFAVFAASIRAALQPVGGAEELLVDRIVAVQWRLKRVQRVELGLFEAEGHAATFVAANEKLECVANGEHEMDARVRRTLAKLPDIPWWRQLKNPRALTDAVIAVADLEERNERGPAELARAFGAQLLAFGLLSRYEAPLRRELTSALHDLERQQRRRREEAIPVASAAAAQKAPDVGAAETPRTDPAPNAPSQSGEDADRVDRVAATDPYRDPQFRRAVERRIRAKSPGLRPPEDPGNSPDDANAPVAVADFTILRDALAPIIGDAWPEDADVLGESLADVGRQVEDEGINTTEEGRQSAVHPRVRKSAGFPAGAVDVIDVPEYIAPDLIHALPDPELWPCLGDVVERRTVGRTDRPAPGHRWYVVQHVWGLGPRLRLWDQTYWPDVEKWTDADASAFVSWWNDGVAAGWDRLSKLNEADVDGMPFFLHEVPAEVVALLKPTPALDAWTARFYASSVDQPPEVVPTEPLDDETNPRFADRMPNDTAEVIAGITPEESRGLPMGGTASLQGDGHGNKPNGAGPVASDREESTAQNEPRPVATAPPARSYTAAALVDAMRRREIQPMDALLALRQGAASYTIDDLAGIVTAAPFPGVKQEAIRLLAERDEPKRAPR